MRDYLTHLFLDLLFFWLFLQFLCLSPPLLPPFLSHLMFTLPLFSFYTTQPFPLAEISIIYVLIFTDSTCHSMNEVTASSVIPISSILSQFSPKSLLAFHLCFSISPLTSLHYTVHSFPNATSLPPYCFLIRLLHIWHPLLPGL